MKILRWAAFNIPVLACMIAGLVGIAGAWNIFMFVLWFMFLMAAAVVLTKVGLKPEECNNIPKWLDVSYDLAMILPLVWFGHTFAAVLYVLTLFFQSVAIAQGKKNVGESKA